MAPQAQAMHTVMLKKEIYGGRAEHPEYRMRGQARRTSQSHYKWVYFSRPEMYIKYKLTKSEALCTDSSAKV